MVKGSEGGPPGTRGPGEASLRAQGHPFPPPAQPHHHSPLTALSLSLAARFPVTTPSYPFRTRWLGADPPPPATSVQLPTIPRKGS